MASGDPPHCREEPREKTEKAGPESEANGCRLLERAGQFSNKRRGEGTRTHGAGGQGGPPGGGGRTAGFLRTGSCSVLRGLVFVPLSVGVSCPSAPCPLRLPPAVWTFRARPRLPRAVRRTSMLLYSLLRSPLQSLAQSHKGYQPREEAT